MHTRSEFHLNHTQKFPMRNEAENITQTSKLGVNLENDKWNVIYSSNEIDTLECSILQILTHQA